VPHLRDGFIVAKVGIERSSAFAEHIEAPPMVQRKSFLGILAVLLIVLLLGWLTVHYLARFAGH
jgi:hypothetical protein